MELFLFLSGPLISQYFLFSWVKCSHRERCQVMGIWFKITALELESAQLLLPAFCYCRLFKTASSLVCDTLVGEGMTFCILALPYQILAVAEYLINEAVHEKSICILNKVGSKSVCLFKRFGNYNVSYFQL